MTQSVLSFRLIALCTVFLPVSCSARDWMGYPNLSGAADSVSRDTWGGQAFHRNYMEWWFSHLPHAKGTGYDGFLANWWSYVFGYQQTIISRRGHRVLTIGGVETVSDRKNIALMLILYVFA